MKLKLTRNNVKQTLKRSYTNDLYFTNKVTKTKFKSYE